MKARQMAKMPSALLNWLETQLDSRGIDSDICARYLISILQVHSTEILASEDDSFWIKVPIGTGSKRNNKKIYGEDDVEQIKKITAVTFLLSKTEESCGIEALVDELWEKLNKFKDSETESEIKRETQQAEEEEANLNGERIVIESANTESLTKQELAEKYYKAFPALNSKLQADINFTNLGVYQWPTLKSSFKIDIQGVKETIAKSINSVNQEIQNYNNKLNLTRDELRAQEILMETNDKDADDDSKIEWDHITKNTMKIIETDSDSDEYIDYNRNDVDYRVPEMAVNKSISLDEWFAASEPWINYGNVSVLQNLNEIELDDTTILLNESYVLDDISICSGDTDDSVDYDNLDYSAIKKIWCNDKAENTNSEADRQSNASNSISTDKKEVDIKEKIKEMKSNFWMGKKLWDLSKQEAYYIDSDVCSSEKETNHHQPIFLSHIPLCENLYTANNWQGKTDSNICNMKSAFASYSAITDAKKQMENTLLLQTCDHPFGDIVHSAAAMHNHKYHQNFKEDNSHDSYYFKPIRPTPPPPDEEVSVHYPDGTTFRVDKGGPTLDFQSNGFKQLYIDTSNCERHYYQTFTWQPLLSDDSHHLLNITALNDFIVKFELKQNDKACQTSVEDCNEVTVTAPLTTNFSYFHAINISDKPMDETIPIAHSTPTEELDGNAQKNGASDYWLNWHGRPNISLSDSKYKGELIRQSQQDANELLAELNQEIMQQSATEAVERFVENGVLLGF